MWCSAHKTRLLKSIQFFQFSLVLIWSFSIFISEIQMYSNTKFCAVQNERSDKESRESRLLQGTSAPGEAVNTPCALFEHTHTLMITLQWCALLSVSVSSCFPLLQIVDRCVCDVQSVGSPYPERVWCLDYFEGDLQLGWSRWWFVGSVCRSVGRWVSSEHFIVGAASWREAGVWGSISDSDWSLEASHGVRSGSPKVQHGSHWRGCTQSTGSCGWFKGQYSYWRESGTQSWSVFHSWPVFRSWGRESVIRGFTSSSGQVQVIGRRGSNAIWRSHRWPIVCDFCIGRSWGGTVCRFWNMVSIRSTHCQEFKIYFSFSRQ